MRKRVPDKRSPGDATHAVVKVAVSAVPLIGNPLAELVGLIQTPLEKRRNEFFQDLADRIAHLEEQGFLKREGLSENQAFIDAVAVAAQVSVRTSQEDRRAALRNAVLNAALGQVPDEAERHMFLELVDRFTAWHLRILKAFQNPVLWAQQQDVRYEPSVSSSSDAFLKRAFPELAARAVFYRWVWEDLSQAGLVAGNLDSAMAVTGWQSSRTTEVGNSFLAFVEEPQAGR